MNSKKVYLRPRPKFHAGALEDYECGCTHAPYCTLVSTLHTKNIITSYEATNKNKNTNFMSLRTIKTYDNKANGGEKTFARSTTLANKQVISPPSVEEGKLEKKWTVKERPQFYAGKLEEDHQCGCTHSYYNSVIMDLRTRYQSEFENDKDFVVKKKRIKSTATVGDVFDQSYSSKDASRTSKQKSSHRKKTQQTEEDDENLTNQSLSSKTSASVKIKERKTSKKKRNRSRAGDRDEEEYDIEQTNKSTTSVGTIKSSRSKFRGNDSAVVKRKAKKRAGKAQNEEDEELSPSALLQTIDDIQKGVTNEKGKRKTENYTDNSLISAQKSEKTRVQGQYRIKSSQKLNILKQKSLGISKTPSSSIFDDLERLANENDGIGKSNKPISKAYSSKEIPYLHPAPPVGTKTEMGFLKKGMKYQNKFLGYDNHQERRFAQFSSLTLKKTLSMSSKAPMSGINTPDSHRGKLEGFDYDEEDMELSSKQGNNMQNSFEGSDDQRSFSVSYKKKRAAKSLADLAIKEKHQKSKFKSKDDENINYTKKYKKMIESEINEKNEQEIEEENKMLEDEMIKLKRQLGLYEDYNTSVMKLEDKTKPEQMMIMIRELANKEETIEAIEKDIKKDQTKIKLLVDEQTGKIQSELAEVRKKIEEARKENKKLEFENKTAGKNLNEIKTSRDNCKKECADNEMEFKELTKKFNALKQKNCVGFEERMQTIEEDRNITYEVGRIERVYNRMFMTPEEIKKEHERMQNQAKNLEDEMKHYENSLKFKKSQIEREFRSQKMMHQKNMEEDKKKGDILRVQSIEVDKLIARNMKNGNSEVREVLEYLKYSMEDDASINMESMNNLEEMPKPVTQPKLMRGMSLGVALKIDTERSLGKDDQEAISGRAYAVTSRNKIVAKNEPVKRPINTKVLKKSGTVGELAFPELKSNFVRSIVIGETGDLLDGAKSARINELNREQPYAFKLQKYKSEKARGESAVDLLGSEEELGFKIRTIPNNKTSVKMDLRKGKIVINQQQNQASDKVQSEIKSIVKGSLTSK